MINTWWKKICLGTVLVFAAIGLFLTAGFVALKFGLTNTAGIFDNNLANLQSLNSQDRALYPANTKFSWNQGPEWEALETAIIEDALLIRQVSTAADINPRLLVAPLVVEQLRLFHTEREVFKQFFGPLKILGNQTQFSWGVLGMKEKTAKQVEENLKNRNSPAYLGARYENILDFTTPDPDSERFNRLTHEDDRYYAYLYGALYIKQLMQQWEVAGFDISDKPEIVATLFNIGFDNSKPKASPAPGGAEIEINNQKSSFGRLAYEFYYSSELVEYFPVK